MDTKKYLANAYERNKLDECSSRCGRSIGHALQVKGNLLYDVL